MSVPTLTQLEYLLAVHRTGHFGKAAASCSVAQPTLSMQIQKAEAELGITIFARNTKPIQATPRGRALLIHAQEVVAAHQRLLWSAREQAGEVAGRFALGVIPTLAPYVTPWFVPHFARKYPKVELALFEKPTDMLIEEMHHLRLDAALLATPLGEESLTEWPLFYDPFYVYAHPDEPLLEQSEVDPAQLDERKLWLLDDGHCLRNQVINFCSISNTEERIQSVSFAAGSLETLRYLIDASGGYTLVPETFARTLPRPVRQARVRPFAPTTPTREVSLAFARSSWKSDVLEALRDCIKAHVPRALRQVSPTGDVVPIR